MNTCMKHLIFQMIESAGEKNKPRKGGGHVYGRAYDF